MIAKFIENSFEIISEYETEKEAWKMEKIVRIRIWNSEVEFPKDLFEITE